VTTIALREFRLSERSHQVIENKDRRFSHALEICQLAEKKDVSSMKAVILWKTKMFASSPVGSDAWIPATAEMTTHYAV
jgi:hypothetical protein